jgi:hypothetical protein
MKILPYPLTKPPGLMLGASTITQSSATKEQALLFLRRALLVGGFVVNGPNLFNLQASLTLQHR